MPPLPTFSSINSIPTATRRRRVSRSHPQTINYRHRRRTQQTSGLYFIQSDYLNTPRIVEDANRKSVWQWDDGAFGTHAANQNPHGAGIFYYNPRFTGQFFDKETGNHYNSQRDYNPGTGRYLESDPLGLAGGAFSTYGYVGGDPIMHTDPLGLINYSDVAFGAAGFVSGLVETTVGGFAAVEGVAAGPAAPKAVSGGLLVMSVGTINTINGGLQFLNGLNDQTGPGIMEMLMGDKGKALDIGAAIATPQGVIRS